MPDNRSERHRLAKERALRSLDTLMTKDDAAITAAAEADPENPPLGEEFWRHAKPLAAARLARMPAVKSDAAASAGPAVRKASAPVK